MRWLNWLKMHLMIGTVMLVGVESKRVHGADTVEPFDVGATDFELSAGVDGLGLGKTEKTVFGDVVLGYGILPRLSGYFQTTLSSNEYLADGAMGVAFGGYGTVVDTHHFDVDLFLDFAGGEGDTAVSSSFELNLDGDPEMRSVGVYLRGGISFYGRDTGSGESETSDDEIASQLEATFGAYVTLGEFQQVLLEFDMLYRPDALDVEPSFDIGGVAMGYNVMLTDRLELINQVFVDVPRNDDPWGVGVSTGFIATMP